MKTINSPPTDLPPTTPASYTTAPLYSDKERALLSKYLGDDFEAKEIAERRAFETTWENFLAYLGRDGSVNLACQSAGLDPLVVYRLSDSNPSLAAHFNRVHERGLKNAIAANLQAIVSKTHEDGSLDAHHKLHKVLLDALKLNGPTTSYRTTVGKTQTFEAVLASVRDAGKE